MNLIAQARQVARPLRVLVPLIQEELVAGNDAGLEHYRRAGVMLIEAKQQVAHGSWSRWLAKNFELSQTSAQRYMRLVRLEESASPKSTLQGGNEKRGLFDAIGEKQGRAAWTSVHHAADKVNVTRLADERQARDTENKLHREIALKLIDLGYRAMATRLHPDRGGSQEAMRRLSAVRDELKQVAETKRFV